MSEWEVLKARYGSNRQYLNRKISVYDWEDFKNYLVDSGADVFDVCVQNEMFRFKLNGELGIVYNKGSGSLLAHNMAAEYNRANNEETLEVALKDEYYRKWKGV